VGNEIALVESDAVGFECTQVAVGGLVVPAKLVAVAVEPGKILAPRRDVFLRQRRHGDAILAEQLGGHALANLGLDVGIDHHFQVGMAVRVDEAWSHDHSPGIDHTIEPAGVLHLADRRDQFVLNHNAGRKARLPRAIDDPAVLNQRSHAA
jgi:hypothetical protein